MLMASWMNMLECSLAGATVVAVSQSLALICDSP